MNRVAYIKSLHRFVIDSLVFSYRFENSLLPPQLNEYCLKRVEDSLFPVAILSIFGAFVYNIFAAVVEPWFPLLDRFSVFLPAYHVFLCALLFISLLAVRPGKFHIFYVFLSSYFFVFNLAYSVICRALLNVPTYGTPELFYFLYHNSISILLLVLFPHHRFFPNAIYCIFSIFLGQWTLAGLPDQFLGSFLISLIFGVTLFLKTMVWSIVVFGYKMEFESRNRLISAERALLAKEFEFARQIQDSIKPAPLIPWNGHLLHYFNLKHESVGGDWVGVHQDEKEKNLIVVIADAMGKGLQASLVIHAVQSLWAEHVPKSKGFDAQHWMQCVNEALFYMGKEAIHMVTMGVAVFKDNGEGMYWSAGHVPLYLIDENLKKKVSSVLSAGSPLGVFPQNHIVGTPFSFGDKKYVVLGSDGVFYKGTRHTSRDVLRILHHVEIEGSLAQIAPEIPDDKTLLTLSVGGQALRSPHLKEISPLGSVRQAG